MKNFKQFILEISKFEAVDVQAVKTKLKKIRMHNVRPPTNDAYFLVDLFVDNDSTLNRGQIPGIWKNLARKILDDKYDHNKAVKIWLNLVDTATKMLMRDEGIIDTVKNFFPKKERELLAKQMADAFIDELIIGGQDLVKLATGR